MVVKSDDLSVDLMGLPTEEGSTVTRDVSWTVGPGWGTEVLTLPEGQQIPLAVALTQLDDGVLVSVRGEATLHGSCVRCLDPVEVHVPIEVDEVFAEEPALRRKYRKKAPLEDSIEVEGDELDEGFVIENETVDLTGVLRDAIFAEAPLQPLCEPDCSGMCEHCGIRLRDAGPDHHHELLGPRFAALAALLEESPSGPEDDRSEGKNQ